MTNSQRTALRWFCCSSHTLFPISCNGEYFFYILILYSSKYIIFMLLYHKNNKMMKKKKLHIPAPAKNQIKDLLTVRWQSHQIRNCSIRSNNIYWELYDSIILSYSPVWVANRKSRGLARGSVWCMLYGLNNKTALGSPPKINGLLSWNVASSFSFIC